MSSEFNGSENVNEEEKDFGKLKYIHTLYNNGNEKDQMDDIDSPYNNLFFHNFEQLLLEHIKNNHTIS